MNLYAYVLNDPVNFVDPFGLSSLYYNTNTNKIYLYNSSMQLTGVGTAHNNVDSSAVGKFPNGTYSIRNDPPPHQTHTDDCSNSSYGSYGSVIFDVPGRTNMAVHSGRQNIADGLGRTGTKHATMGCIRTTDSMMEKIVDTLSGDDPITTITVGTTPPQPKF